MLLADFIRTSANSLERLYPSQEARGIVLMLCAERLGVSSYAHIVEPALEIPGDLLPGLMEDMGRLERAEPIQYVLGFAEFCGHRFKVGPGVLIPRPETEQLVQESISLLQTCGSRSPRMLDLCTGSGCIAWSVAAEVPAAEIVAADISEDALAVARSQNISSSVPQFIRMDVLDGSCPFCHGKFDVIVSNPPYIMESEKGQMRPNVLEYEPDIALFVPDGDPLVFYRAVAAWAKRLLKPGGSGVVEINEALPEQTAGVFRTSGFGKVEIIDDFFKKARFVRFCL